MIDRKLRQNTLMSTWKRRKKFRHIVDRRVESPKADRPGPNKRNYSIGDELAGEWNTQGRGWGSLDELERRLNEHQV